MRQPAPRAIDRVVVRAFVVTALVLAGAVPAGAATAAPPERPAPVPVRARLLPVPAAAPGQTVTVSVADVTPSGVVGGTIEVLTQAPDGSQTFAVTAHRWFRTPAGWRRQQLAQPAGAPYAFVAGLTDAGEAGGTLEYVGAPSRAVRWSADGRRIVAIGEPGSRVSAVGPDGPWAVHTDDPNGISGGSELVDRRGLRTPLRGTPELDAGFDRTVLSVAGPRTAVVGVRTGAGGGGTVTPVLYRDGATLALPVVFTVFGTTCLSQVRPDGSIVYSGVRFAGDVPQVVLARHVGGVPGREVPLAPVGTPDGPTAWLGCQGNGVTDRLAADGGVAGALREPAGEGWTTRAAYWNARGVRTPVPLAAGELSAVGAAVATGGRMVIRAETAAGPALSLWRHGVRTPLTLPAGWTARHVVELTDAGLLVAVVANATGVTRPAVWDVSRR
jgi:hypothetical protein